MKLIWLIWTQKHHFHDISLILEQTSKWVCYSYIQWSYVFIFSNKTNIYLVEGEKKSHSLWKLLSARLFMISWLPHCALVTSLRRWEIEVIFILSCFILLVGNLWPREVQQSQLWQGAAGTSFKFPYSTDSAVPCREYGHLPIQILKQGGNNINFPRGMNIYLKVSINFQTW